LAIHFSKNNIRELSIYKEQSVMMTEISLMWKCGRLIMKLFDEEIKNEMVNEAAADIMKMSIDNSLF